MILPAVALIFGIVLLIWSADHFVEGAKATAKYANLPSLLIGMVVVGFGTSAPEMLVSVLAAIDQNPELALGNALGSNIVNTSLVLGITALITPIHIHSKIIKKELPILLAVSLLIGGLFWQGYISRWDALGLLFLFTLFLGSAIWSAYKNKRDVFSAETNKETKHLTLSKKAAFIWMIAGLVILILSSRILVWGAISLANALGISKLIVGLTIVAFGTSLPELAASVAAARKGEPNIALGNIIGSNMFNLLGVIGIAGIITPIPVEQAVIWRDWIALIVLFVLLFIFVGFKKMGEVNRVQGGLLVAFYIIYTFVLGISLVG